MTGQAPQSLLVPSAGGPNWMGWFRVEEPVPLELPCRGGTYVLECGPADGAPQGEGWSGEHARCGGHRYVFVDDG